MCERAFGYGRPVEPARLTLTANPELIELLIRHAATDTGPPIEVVERMGRALTLASPTWIGVLHARVVELAETICGPDWPARIQLHD